MDGLFANQTEQAAKPLEGQLPGADSGATYQSNGMTELSNHVATTNHVSDSPKIAKLENHHSSTPSSSKHHSSSSKHHSSSSKDSSKHSSSSSKHHSSSSSSKHSSSSSKHHSSSSSKDPSKHSSSSSSSSKDPSKHSSSSSKHSSSSSKDPSKHSSSSSKHSSSSSKDPSKHSSSSSKHSSSSSKDPSKHSSSSSKDPSKHSSSSSKDPSKHSSSSSKDPSKHSSSSSKDPSKHSSSSSKHSSSSSKDPSKHSSSSSKDPSKHSSSSSKDPSKHSSSSSKDPSKHHSSSSKPKDGSSSHSSSGKHKDGSSKHHSSSSKHHSPSSSQKPKDGSSAFPTKPVKQEFLGGASTSPRAPKLTIKMDGPTKEARLEIKVEQMSPEKIEAMRFSPTKVKAERMDESDDDIPLSDRKKVKDQKPVKRHLDLDSEDEAPLSDRMKKAKQEEKESRKRKHEDEDFSPGVPKKKKKEKKPVKQEQKTPIRSPDKKKKKKEGEEETRWRWWEDEKKDDGTKWRTLEHKGPVFAPDYIPLPKNVRFYYDGKPMTLAPETEEVATFYGRMIEHDYTTKDIFNKNFMKDWRKVMTPKEREIITDLKKCNFNEINEHFKRESEARKNRSKEEKQAEKEKNAAITEEYGFCIIDGHKQKIGNFRIEPPGLFRGRGEHPKQGMLKRRTQPEDVIINCSKGAAIPQAPEGHRWKEVRHDNTVTWLCCWSENVQNQTKYVMLSAASKLKGEKDWQKYETARKLHKIADRIRRNYHEDFKSKEMRVRQRAVAMYFIDKLALRAGNEKDEDQADTVGCCSLRVEHLKLHEEMDGKDYMVEFDFLGKDSIRYYNKVQVEKRVFKNLQLFMENKSEGDDLFDRLNTAILNKHLASLMDGLTAKVFRTYNASKTLQEQLNLLTNPDDPIAAKILSYNRANRAVAVLCNHQRAAPKNFSQQMERLQEKIDAKKEAIRTAKKEVKACKSDLKHRDTNNNKKILDRKKKAVARLQEQLVKLEVQATDKDENKEIALGTSKLNYLDPRISVAWCKKFDVPIEKIYNKTQRDKFAWAIDMADEDYEF